MKPQKPRATPRISMNKLAEYMTATPARRRGIIREQKQPRDVIVARYAEVYSAVIDCLENRNDVSPVYDRLESLYNAAPRTTWDAQDKQLSADALESFLTFVDEIDLSEFTVVRAGENIPVMSVAGVGVSVKPDLLLKAPDSSEISGGVKLYVSKLFPFEDESGAYAATLLHQFVDTVLVQRTTDPKRCLIIDVFSRKVYVGPRAFRKRRKDLEAACEEIAQRWSAV